jgi:hypothetical protein
MNKPFIDDTGENIGRIIGHLLEQIRLNLQYEHGETERIWVTDGLFGRMVANFKEISPLPRIRKPNRPR